MIVLAGIVIFGVLLFLHGEAIISGFFAIMFSWTLALLILAITLLTFFFSFLMAALTFILAIIVSWFSYIFSLFLI
ncbi:MAG: hypothetical protein CMQ71_00810 [Gammaproteobacteria bacterium]|nr:hypothetical protein [Gammaproteobacteria bacterium]